MTDKDMVFVYGTLRKGGSNHHLIQEADFLGKGTTIDSYAMYAHGIPYVTSREEISQILGEVFRLDHESLKIVDRLEGHPNWYRREKVRIKLLNDGKVHYAWMYFNSAPKGNLIPSGDFFEHY